MGNLNMLTLSKIVFIDFRQEVLRLLAVSVLNIDFQQEILLTFGGPSVDARDPSVDPRWTPFGGPSVDPRCTHR